MAEAVSRSRARTMNADVLSTRQVATLLGVGEATVKRWADAGEIDCFRTPGGHRKFRLRDVTAFVQKRQYETPGVLPDGVPPGADVPGEAAIEHFKASALRGGTGSLLAQLSARRGAPAGGVAGVVLRSGATRVVLSSTMSNGIEEQVRMAVGAAGQTGGRVVVGGPAMLKATLPPEARLLSSLRELDEEAQSAGKRRAR